MNDDADDDDDDAGAATGEGRLVRAGPSQNRSVRQSSRREMRALFRVWFRLRDMQ